MTKYTNKRNLNGYILPINYSHASRVQTTLYKHYTATADLPVAVQLKMSPGFCPSTDTVQTTIVWVEFKPYVRLILLCS